ncbi:MAG: cupredoxin domain-containing protein [Candidatus Thorarchaeota archaeon]
MKKCELFAIVLVFGVVIIMPNGILWVDQNLFKTPDTIFVHLRQYEFDPATIEVSLGDTVELLVTSDDVVHGFSIPDYGINELIYPGHPVWISFVADTAGTFEMACSIWCGVGHYDMTGELVVT